MSTVRRDGHRFFFDPLRHASIRTLGESAVDSVHEGIRWGCNLRIEFPCGRQQAAGSKGLLAVTRTGRFRVDKEVFSVGAEGLLVYGLSCELFLGSFLLLMLLLIKGIVGFIAGPERMHQDR